MTEPSPELAIAEGASAVVYRATMPDGRLVALKNAKPGAADIVAREALLLRALARRWGPALVASGPGWLATEWTEGTPLTSPLADVPPPNLVEIVAHDVGRALAELHAMGLRHGDVKPANILVDVARAKAIAFGSAVDRASERAATLIDVGLVAVAGGDVEGGTPRYLAPEARAGEAVGFAADLWALGLVLAELLDPSLVREANPAAKARAHGREVGGWIDALLSPSPGARPSAAWVADRAAAALGLAADPDDLVAERRARIRRTYLAVRRDALERLAADPSLPLDEAIDGAPREWLEDARGSRDEIVRDRSSEPNESVAREPIRPLDSLGAARWLTALVGPAAAAWPSALGSEGEMAGRMLVLAEHAPPEAWTLDDLTRGHADEPPSLPTGDERWLVMARALARPAPEATILAAAESDLGRAETPSSIAFDVARAWLRRGEIGRASAALAIVAGDGINDLPLTIRDPKAKGRPRTGLPTRPADADEELLAAEILRRRGERGSAEVHARKAMELASGELRDRARGLLGRIAWDSGAIDRAEGEIEDARGALAAEVRGLVAYARGELDAGIDGIEAALREPHEPIDVARLEGTRGMLEHARGNADAAARAFAAAEALATREGAVPEEATYLTGLAAAAADAGDASRAIAAGLRAAVLWERLGRPGLAARALLSRAAAFAMIGAQHDADVAADDARARGLEADDARAAAFARWAIVETRPRGDERAKREALAAAKELGSGEDEIRAAARVVVWAGGEGVDVSAIDERASALTASARWEWWGARAIAGPASPRVLAELRSLLDLPAPLASRGPALAAAMRLASELGDGDAARRFETARRAAAEVLRQGAPPEHRAAAAAVAWARIDEREIGAASAAGMGAHQVEQLETIVRALGSRDRLKPLLEQVLDTMVLWTGVERGLLLLRAPDGRLVPRAARNIARRDLRGEQLTLSMGLAKRAMEERAAISANDAYAQIGDLYASVHALRLRSVLAVPLVARGDVLGVVYLDDRVRRGAFGSSELAWVRLVATQAALAIADARDQALLRRAVRRAERANDRLAAELETTRAELATEKSTPDTRFRYDEIEGRSEPMRAMLKLVDRVTASEVPVLLVGESGTGKELVARAIHANGARQKRAFVSENCASVPETLLESTLFGHMKGAFTGASSTRAGLFDVADGGTLFLDEIGEMPLAMQTKLLRVLQNGEVRPVGGERTHTVDVRIIGATHRDLEAMVAAGTFREDLFYRLNVVAIRVPPLRERVADIPLLVAHFVQKHGPPQKKIRVTRAALDRLSSYPWPGNVRQLENEVRRALVMAAEDKIDASDLSEEVARGGPAAAREAGLGLKARIDALETEAVKEALSRTNGNQTRAADALGISRFGLQKMMRRLKIKGESA